MPSGFNEAFGRVPIGKALDFSKWNLLDHRQVRFELNTATVNHNVPAETLANILSLEERIISKAKNLKPMLK